MLESTSSNPVSLDHWNDPDNRSYNILELYTIADRNDILSTLKDEPVIKVSKNYWYFGEEEHQHALMGFSSYAAALTDLNPWSIGKSLPLNGRYVMNLLLAEESDDTIDVESWVKHICETPFPKSNMNTIILALLSKICKNQLPVSSQHIHSFPLTDAGHVILIFLYMEFHSNQAALCQILARVLGMRRCSNDRHLHEFLLVYGDRIADHVGRVLRHKSPYSSAVEDSIAKVISENILSSDDAASYCASGPNLRDLLKWSEELLDVTHVYGISQGNDNTESEPELEVWDYVLDPIEPSAASGIIKLEKNDSHSTINSQHS